MDENVANKIVRLVEQLADRDAAVEWDEVEELVRDFPGWLRLVQNTRYPSMTSAKYVVSMGSPLQYVVLPRVYRQKLLAFFRPYGILLDLRQPPAERAQRLQEAGYDVMCFCRDNLHDGAAEVVSTAREVMAACRMDRTLLRAASPAAGSSDQLLHTVSSATGAEALLHPSEPNGVENAKTAPVWWKRLFSRRAS